jgi:UDP-glucose 4-epimerase
MTIYGDCRTVPTPETEPCRPDSYYGITKHAAECYVHATAKRSDLDFPFSVTSLRMFSVFGPGQAWDNPYQGVLGIFLGSLQRGEPITIFGDGEQTRDFVYVDDIVEGWVRALDMPQGTSGIFNLGSGNALSINQLAERAIAAYGYRFGEYPIIRAPARPGEQRRVQADISRAKSVLNWEPKTSFAAGLKETIRLGGEVFGNSGSRLVTTGGAR